MIVFAFSCWFCILVFSQFLFYLAPTQKFLVLLANTFQQSHTMQMKEIKGGGSSREKEKTSRYSKQIKTWNQNFLSHTSPPPILVCPYLPKLGKYCRFLRRAAALYPLQACAENWKFLSKPHCLYKHSTRGENWCHRPLGGDYVKLKVTKPLRLCKC